MSVNVNIVTFAGNLTRDPESRDTGSTSVVGFTLANTRKFKSGNETKEETAFLDVEAWGKTGEMVAQYLTKGQPCLVEGRLKQEQWQDKDGNRRTKIKIVAERVHFLGGKRQAGDGGDGGQESPAPQATAERGPSRPRPASAAGDDEPPF